MAYPFAEERKLAQPFFVRVARQLADRGIASIRFDYYGCGNSEGHFRQGSISQWVEDLLSVAGLVNSPGRQVKLSALGLRLGANLILLAMGSGLAIHRALLWNPLLAPADYWREQLRRGQLASAMHKSCGCALGPDIAADLSGNAAGNRLADEIQRMPSLSAKMPVRGVEFAWVCDSPDESLPGRKVTGSAFWTAPAACCEGGFVGETCDWFLGRIAAGSAV